MRKNKSFKDASELKAANHKGKQISIELETSLIAKTLRTKEPRSTSRCIHNLNDCIGHSDRLECSNHLQQNIPLANNILKEIISYSNLPHFSASRTKSNATLAQQCKGYSQHLLTHKLHILDNKISQSQSITRKNSEKLITSQNNSQEKETHLQVKKMVTLLNGDLKSRSNDTKKDISKIFNNLQNSQDQVLQKQEKIAQATHNKIKQMDCNFESSWRSEKMRQIVIQKQKIAERLDEIHAIEQQFYLQFPEVFKVWIEMIKNQGNKRQLEQELERLKKKLCEKKQCHSNTLQRLFEVSKNFINRKKLSEYRSNGQRQRILAEAQKCHDQLIRRVTSKDFQSVVFFNMKVTIPNYKSPGNNYGMYEQLFKNKCSKKFTMLLKKLSSQIDLYEGKILSEYVKKINQLEAHFTKIEHEDQHESSQIDFMKEIAVLIQQIEVEKSDLERTIYEYSLKVNTFNSVQANLEQLTHQVQVHIRDLNNQIQAEYKKSTQKLGDFEIIIRRKYEQKYKQLRIIWLEKQFIEADILRIEQELSFLSGELHN